MTHHPLPQLLAVQRVLTDQQRLYELLNDLRRRRDEISVAAGEIAFCTLVGLDLEDPLDFAAFLARLTVAPPGGMGAGSGLERNYFYVGYLHANILGVEPSATILAVSARAPQGFLGLDHHGLTALIRTTGNPDGHLVLRGGSSGPNFGMEAIEAAKAQLRKSGVRSQLLVDCSHGNSNKDHTKQSTAFKDVVSQRLAGNTDIIGCMVESNINPGSQKLGDDPSALEYGVSITDACIGWDETETLLRWAHAALDEKARLATADAAGD